MKKYFIIPVVIALVLYSMTFVYFWYWFLFSTLCLLVCMKKALSET
jgi:hypothetical protein